MPAESVEVGGVLHISAHGVEFIFGIDAAKRIRIDVVEFGVGVLKGCGEIPEVASFELSFAGDALLFIAIERIAFRICTVKVV